MPGLRVVQVVTWMHGLLTCPLQDVLAAAAAVLGKWHAST